MSEIKHVSFVIPVLGDELYYAQRGTEPRKGLYGPIGGKADPYEFGGPEKPRMVEAFAGHLKVSFADRLARAENREYTLDTAVRELFEEGFSKKKYPNDFKESDISDPVLLGKVTDTFKQMPFLCYIYMLRLNREDFSFSEREITDFKPVRALSAEQIYPLGQSALIQLRLLLEHEDYLKAMPELRSYKKIDLKQIPENLQLDKVMITNMHGMMVHYAQKGLI